MPAQKKKKKANSFSFRTFDILGNKLFQSEIFQERLLHLFLCHQHSAVKRLYVIPWFLNQSFQMSGPLLTQLVILTQRMKGNE